MHPVPVLYLSYDGMTDPLGQSQVIPYLTGLSKEGYQFFLVSFEKKDVFEKNRNEISALLKSNNIAWHPLPYTKNPPIVSTVWDLNRMKNKGLELINANQIKIIHCRSYISGLAGMYLKNKTGVKFIFDIRGFWADERVEGGLWNLSNPFYKTVYNFFKRKEKEMLKAADAVISLTQNAKVEMDSWKIRSTRQLEIKVIPCCADLKLFSSLSISETQKSEFAQNLEIPEGSPVITYLGTIGTWYMLDEMLDFYGVLQTRIQNLIFLFITHENPETIISKANIKNIKTDNLRFFKASRKEVPLALSVGDISLFFIKPVYSKKASSPTKQGEIMGMGIPVICNKGIGDTDTIITKYESGFLVDAGDQKSYESAIQNFSRIKNLDRKNIRKGAEDFFSLESGVKKYLEVYKSLGT